ncbi:MAG TPA: HAMP domain-containing sensor histidine kinase [Acidimicrobiales bacterium]|nr:HAMP domain-containing sensor histidine kinase [Acidimicrobiales bacterium]
MRLHRRLTLTMAALLVIGLAAADVVTYTSLHSFLYGRLDAQLDSTQVLANRYLVHESDLGRRVTSEGIDDHVNQDIYVVVLGPDGRVTASRPDNTGPSYRPGPPPVVTPSAVRAPTAPKDASTQGAYRPNPEAFTLASADPAVRYRAEASTVPQGVLVTAISLGPTQATLDSLLRIEIVVSVVVLVALCVLVLWTIRRGLRPLDDMTRTAGAIASGDLTRRVDPAGDDSEVGRLGTALNGMLTQIETAFVEKSRSEARLRQFVADASHELRTPLTSIRGYAELLRKGAFSDEDGRQRALARVEHEAARMGGLVDDLLLLARLDQGRQLQHVPVDLRRICRDAVFDAQAADPDRPIDLVAPSPVVVAGDRDRLAQVAHNLVRNALSHTPPGTPVRVEVAAAGPWGLLRVTDEGPGLDPAQAARVFDRFYRGDAARTGQGTGLGLSIVQAIAESLGGRARVASAPGRGATFTVELPLDGAASRAAPEAESGPTGHRPAGGRPPAPAAPPAPAPVRLPGG